MRFGQERKHPMVIGVEGEGVGPRICLDGVDVRAIGDVHYLEDSGITHRHVEVCRRLVEEDHIR
jgi:hypothetical protein